MNLSKLQETVKEREAWRAVVHGVTKGQKWLSDWTTTKEIAKGGYQEGGLSQQRKYDRHKKKSGIICIK